MEKSEFGDIKKVEQNKNVRWETYVKVSRGVDKFGEADEEVNLLYENGKFFADRKEITCEDFLNILGHGVEILYRQKPEMKEIIKKISLEEKKT